MQYVYKRKSRLTNRGEVPLRWNMLNIYANGHLIPFHTQFLCQVEELAPLQLQNRLLLFCGVTLLGNPNPHLANEFPKGTRVIGYQIHFILGAFSERTPESCSKLSNAVADEIRQKNHILCFGPIYIFTAAIFPGSG